MTRIRSTLLPGLAAVIASGSFFMACGGSGGGGGIAGIGAGAMGDAIRADVSGQQSAFNGTLGSGVTITFPAVKGQNYLISVETTKSKEEVTFDVWSTGGSHLRSKSVESPGGFLYQHEVKNQHVLVLCRPRNPIDTSIGVTKLTVMGVGSFPKDKVHLNVFLCGKFTGYGAYGNMVTQQQQAQFTDAVLAKARALIQPMGIAISYEGFYYTGDQVKAREPGLLAPDDQTICGAGERVNSQGFEEVTTADLDRWASFGFPEGDPSFTRSRGIDVFLIHHFTNDGTVGLSPRPGQLLGNGPDTGMACAAFVKQGNSLTARSVDQIGLVLAHELGHFLGLLHTTTFEPSFTAPTKAIDDGLSDTPACTVLTDKNKDGIVGIGDGCQDEGNVMFYQAGAQTVLSAGQAKVMQSMLSVQEH